jgi:predicted transcriptional regulator
MSCLEVMGICVTLSHMSTLTIRVPESLKRDLKRFSKQHGQSAGDVVRESLKRYLAVEQFQALKKKTLPFAEAQGFLTDEDIFKATS